jgi:acetolactate synthase-1/2/3 large subunit
MNGAQSLSRTLVNGGVNTCFINPGTTEIHLVKALAEEAGMRNILCLFEGVCSGAADGYARMTDKPAAIVLHLGPGLANGIANLHNAKRANSSVVNIVGDHATYHKQYDTPLTSDILSLAKPVSGWLRSSTKAENLAEDGAAAVQASMEPPGQVATLIVPADCAWDPAKRAATIKTPTPSKTASEDRIAKVAAALRSGKPANILLNGQALRAEGLEIVGRIVRGTDVQVMCETFSARLTRGAGRLSVERFPYFPEKVEERLAGLAHLILVGAKPPVAFFAYQGKPSWLTPETCEIHSLASASENALEALEALAEELGANKVEDKTSDLLSPTLPTGVLTTEAVGATLGALLPEKAIVSDESVTSGAAAFAMTTGAPSHDWLFLTGGSMGQGLPVATGAAVACPDRKVICLHGDGGAMYTLQSLWTQVREGLDVTTVIFSNRKYQILREEMTRADTKDPSIEVLRMFDLANPDLDWVQLAGGMGVNASRSETADEFSGQFSAAMAESGPHLIEAIIP